MSDHASKIDYVYEIYQLPTSDSRLLDYLSGKFSAVRLSALQISPEAFGSTFARESAFTIAKWKEFLTRPQFHNFVAVAYPAKTTPEERTLDTGDWIGCGTLIGPTAKASYEILEAGGSEIGSDEEESKWHMTFVYNSPLHRMKGVSKKLIKTAEDFTIKDAASTGKQRTRMRVFLAPNNPAAKGLYSSYGFVDAGMCSFMDAYKANGDMDLAPADGGVSNPNRYHTRHGLIMERICSVKTAKSSAETEEPVIKTNGHLD